MIQILLDNARAAFQPGESINGSVNWSDCTDTSIETRLIWFTSGKAERDFEIAATHSLDTISNSGSERFEFVAPGRPQSFSGKLISLQWAIESIAFPSKSAQRMELVISNTGKEILLQPATKHALD